MASRSRPTPTSGAGPDTITVVGLADLRRRLRKFDKQMDKDLRLALREPVVRARARAKQRAGRYNKSGLLQRSIGMVVTQKHLGIRIRSAKVPYAKAQEWGTSGKSTSKVKPKGTPIKIPRRENLWGAMVEYRSTMVRVVDEATEEAIRKAGFEK
jgi:hypothetical protein